MSADSFTEITRESWLGRIGNAIKGVVIGLVLFVAAFPLLYWNEGRAVRTHKTLEEGGGAVVSVSAERVDPQNSGKLVHMTAKADTNATLADPVFGVSAPALKLRRVVTMYQWDETSRSETQKKLGGGTETVTTYKYNKVWSDEPIDSSRFREQAGHENPATMAYESGEWVAEPVSLGAFRLSRSLVQKICEFMPLPVEGGVTVPEALRNKVRLHEAGFYIGNNPGAPQIGDMRVSFQVVRPTEVSVIARQTGETFEPYIAKAGGTIEMLCTGVQSADTMIRQAQAGNAALTWLLRLMGFVVMLVGLNLVFRPLSVIADVVPLLGSVAEVGTGIVAFAVAAILSIVTIAVGWIVYRPLLGGALLVVAVGLAVAIAVKLKKAKATPQPAMPELHRQVESAVPMPHQTEQPVGAGRN